MLVADARRIALLASLVLAACGSSVNGDSSGGSGGDETGSTGGAGGEAQTVAGGAGGEAQMGGGEPLPSPRMIEIDFESYFHADDPWRMLVNSADGTLKQTLPIAELPAQVEVENGDLVSFLAPVPYTYRRLHSYRVTPDVTRVAHREGEGGGAPYPCDIEPMQVTVVFPEVEGALLFRAWTDYYGYVSADTAGEAQMDVISCGDTFDVFAFALGENGIIGYELLEDLPFSPGVATPLPLTLGDDTRATIDVTLEDLDGLGSIKVDVDWGLTKGLLAAEHTDDARLVYPQGTQTVEVTPIAPGGGRTSLHIYAREPRDEGGCRGATVFDSVIANDRISYAPKRLSSVHRLGADSWEFTTEGEKGDFIWQQWEFGEGLGDVAWLLREDPTRPVLSAVFPELPSDAEWPDTVPRLYEVGHHDIFTRDGYAALLGDPVWRNDTSPYEYRSSACER